MRPFEEVSDRLFAGTNVLVEDLWSLDRDEVETAFLRDGRREQRFPATGIPVQEDSDVHGLPSAVSSMSQTAAVHSPGAQAQWAAREDCAVLGRPLERFSKGFPSLDETADVGPLHFTLLQFDVPQRQGDEAFLGGRKIL